MSGYLSVEQVDQLLAPINPRRVLARDGMSYVAAHDVKAHLNRIFGFGRWSSEVVEQSLIFEEAKQMKNGKDGWYVCYRSVVRLTVCAPDGTVLATYTEGHVGDNTGPTRGDVHGNAVANSESYALKRCAAMLGDQFGLSLYEKGSKQAFVKGTLVHPEAAKGDVQGSEVTCDGNDERTTDTEPPATPSPTDSPAPATDQADREPAESDDGSSSPEAVVAELRERVIAAMHLDRREAMPKFAKLAAEAVKAKVHTHMTTSPGGTPMTLGALIDSALAHVSKPPPQVHGVHDDEQARDEVPA